MSGYVAPRTHAEEIQREALNAIREGMAWFDELHAKADRERAKRNREREEFLKDVMRAARKPERP